MKKKLWAVGLVLISGAALFADEPPVLPVGGDAYRMWDHWADQRIGERAYMRSTYDRNGANEGSDASHFLFQLSDTANVSLDLEGAGEMVFMRYNHWHGSPWHYVVDGTDYTVQESMSADPLAKMKDSTFIPPEPFPAPFAYTWATTKGADLIWTPIGFEKTFRMVYERTHYGTGYYIYDQFVPGAALSSPIKAWDGKMGPGADLVALVNQSGSDLVQSVPTVEAKAEGLALPKDGPVTLVDLAGSATIRAIDFSVPTAEAIALGHAHLRITWDGRSQPSIDAPIALFFGAGTLYNRENAEYLVKAFPVNIHFVGDRVQLACYFPMPFFKSAHVELIGNGEAPLTDITWSIRSMPFTGPANHVGYFHATYRDHGVPTPGKDLVLLDTREQEGSAVWSGSLVGTSFIFSDRTNLTTLEGDPRFFLDDSRTPQEQGTGTEEWGGGGDYWGGRNMTLPFAGHPTGARNPKEVRDPEDQIESAYRFLLADLMPFGSNAVIQLEHGGSDESSEHYQSVTYWYGLPAASLVKSDSLQIGDAASEKQHAYLSPDASAPYAITSRYEVGVSSAHGVQVVPTEVDNARKTTGTSQFTLQIDPANVGVMLRRKLDYSFPNQRAEVSVADASEPETGAAWKPAGIWYTAGSNTFAYSNPKGEADPTEHNIKVSNRQFRDDEFLLPLALTKGRSGIGVRVKFTPVSIPLFPGNPLPELAWSEIRYDAYSYVMPAFTAPAK